VAAGYRDTQEWIDKLIARDSDAWRIFLQQIGPMVMGICRRSGLGGDYIDDTAQALVLKLLENNCRALRRLDVTTDEKFFSWAKVVAGRMVIDEIRIGKVRQGYEEKWAEERYRDLFASPINDPIEVRVLLDRAAADLPPEDQVLFQLDLAGLKHKEIGLILGLTLTAVQKRHTRMRERLRDICQVQRKVENS
jgi:RNA polymerase sigma factor (sigma-70 family)